MSVVVGIDVAGAKKGFHCAALQIDTHQVVLLQKYLDTDQLVFDLRALKINIQTIAIDCPSSALIDGPLTRAAERELHQRGYRVQFTRRRGRHEPQEWMINGQRLWAAIRQAFTDVKIIETFPTAASEKLDASRIELPLRLICGKEKRAEYKDYIDALICADVALRLQLSQIDQVGENDELEPIYF